MSSSKCTCCRWLAWIHSVSLVVRPQMITHHWMRRFVFVACGLSCWAATEQLLVFDMIQGSMTHGLDLCGWILPGGMFSISPVMQGNYVTTNDDKPCDVTAESAACIPACLCGSQMWSQIC